MIRRFGQLKVIASMQPSHQTTDMRWAEDRLGQRIKGPTPGKMLKNGVRLAFGRSSVEVIAVRACTLALLGRRWRAENGWSARKKFAG